MHSLAEVYILDHVYDDCHRNNSNGNRREVEVLYMVYSTRAGCLRSIFKQEGGLLNFMMIVKQQKAVSRFENGRCGHLEEKPLPVDSKVQRNWNSFWQKSCTKTTKAPRLPLRFQRQRISCACMCTRTCVRTYMYM